MRPLLVLISLVACSKGGDEGTAPAPGPSRVLEGPFTGAALSASRDVDGDGVVDLVVSAPGLDDSGGLHALSGPAGEVGAADAFATLTGSPGEGGASFALCDADGDAALDALLGAPALDEKGGAWLVHGPLSGASSAGAGLVARGSVDEGGAGAVVACGDLDGDGLDELALSAPFTDGNGAATGSGTIYLYEEAGGALDRFATFDTTWSDSQLGLHRALLLDDLDGDGLADLAVGAHRQGMVHLAFGPFTGSLSASTAGPTLSGGDDEGTGHALDAGDADGDGYADLLVGSPFSGGEKGLAQVVYGPITEETDGYVHNERHVNLSGVAAGDQAGWEVAFAGDVDGDGADDVLVGAPYAGGVGEAAGAVYLVLGPGEGAVDLDVADALILSDTAQAHFGAALDGGDLDGDGVPEIVIGAPEADVGGVIGAGAVYWFDGGVRGTVYPDVAEGRFTL